MIEWRAWKKLPQATYHDLGFQLFCSVLHWMYESHIPWRLNTKSRPFFLLLIDDGKILLSLSLRKNQQNMIWEFFEKHPFHYLKFWILCWLQYIGETLEVERFDLNIIYNVEFDTWYSFFINLKTIGHRSTFYRCH